MVYFFTEDAFRLRFRLQHSHKLIGKFWMPNFSQTICILYWSYVLLDAKQLALHCFTGFDETDFLCRIGGVNTISNSFCRCGDSGAQPFEDSFTGNWCWRFSLDHTELSALLLHICVLDAGLKNFPGLKRKSCGDLQIEESSHGYPGMDVPVNSKRRHINFGNQSVHRTESQSHGYLEMVKANSSLNHSTSPCAVEGCLSKGFAGLLSGPSCL